MSAIVTLKKGEGRTIKAGGAWIYDNEIDTIMGIYQYEFQDHCPYADTSRRYRDQ